MQTDALGPGAVVMDIGSIASSNCRSRSGKEGIPSTHTDSLPAPPAATNHIHTRRAEGEIIHAGKLPEVGPTATEPESWTRWNRWAQLAA